MLQFDVGYFLFREYVNTCLIFIEEREQTIYKIVFNANTEDLDTPLTQKKKTKKLPAVIEDSLSCPM
jgi:hypothetical protein